MSRGYASRPLSFNRRVVRASASVTRRRNTIHCMAQADVTEARRLIREQTEKSGKKYSFTAYVVMCLAQVLKQHPGLNSFIRRNRLVVLEDVTVSVLVEREFLDERTPEPVGIRRAQAKTYGQISEEIRGAATAPPGKLGSLSGSTWIRWVPAFLLRAVIRLAETNLKMAMRYGNVAVTAVGLFTREPVRLIPHGSATVLLTVGGIEKRTRTQGDRLEEREILCLTGSFDHDIVDGAPAARFMNQLLETLTSGSLLPRSWKEAVSK